jgi:hypothetical protein
MNAKRWVIAAFAVAVLVALVATPVGDLLIGLVSD